MSVYRVPWRRRAQHRRAWIGTLPAETANAFTSFGGNFPTVQVQIDFVTPPTSPHRSWVDVTADTRSLSIRRGRDNELARTTPSTLTLTLSNLQRQYDPTNTGGAYYGLLLPMRRVRVRVAWNSVIYNLFHGYVEKWPPSWPEEGFDAVVQVTATDAFKVLNLHDLGGNSYAAQTSGTRIAAAIEAAGFTTAERSIETGQSTMGTSGTIAAEVAALTHVQDVVDTENGVLFFNGGGTWVFHDRHHRPLFEATSAGTILDNGGSGIYYRDVAANYGDDFLYNRARVTPAGGTAEIVTNAASTANYYTRTVTRDLLVTSQNEALNCAGYLVARYKDPYFRVEEVEVVGAAAPSTVWPLLLPLEISDRVTFERRPPGGGTITEDQFVEAFQFDIDRDRRFDVRLRMSPADKPGDTAWVLGDAVNGLLGVSTILGY